MGLETGIRTIVKEAVREEVRSVVREELNSLAPRPVDQAEQAYLSVVEAAELLGVEHKTVRRWISEGALPALRRGKVLRIRRSDLEALKNRRNARDGSAEVEDEVRRLLRKR